MAEQNLYMEELDSSDEEEQMEEVVGVERNVTADGGIKKKVISLGQGYLSPEKGDEVTVHYVGTLLDGTKFDSSRDRSDPFKFSLGVGQVIKGWDEGVATMKKGEKSLLTCTADYAYGAAGSPPTIPPNATLQFEVELLSWKSEKDISGGDGGVIKAILSEGSGWQRPKDKDEAIVKYKAYIKGQDQPFATTPDEGQLFVVNEGHLCPAIAMAVKTMKKGERVSLDVKPDYGCNTEPFQREDVPPGTDLDIKLELLAWNEVSEVTDDGLVSKKTIHENPSDYKRPNEGAKVTVRYTGLLADGTKFVERLDENEHTYTTDEGEVVEGLDLAVMKMKKEEKAIITVAPKYGFGDSEAQQPLAVVPPGSTLTYEVELVSFENSKEVWEMDEGQKIVRANELKASGNDLFKGGKNDRALKRYTKALKLVEHDTSFKESDNIDAAKALRKSCWLNQAAAQLRLKEYRQVAQTCTKVIEMDRSCVKALFRRAEAHIAMEDYLEANIDLKRALEIDPENRDVMVKIKRAKQLEAAANKKQAKLFGNMFERMAKMEKKETKAEQLPSDAGTAHNATEPAAGNGSADLASVPAAETV